MTAIPLPKKSRRLQRMSVEELVRNFEQLTLAEGQAYADLEVAKSNRIYWQRRDLLSEMRHRDPDQRPALFILYSHRHPHVRASVARFTYALNPERATGILKEIAASRRQPWAADAGMSLLLLEDGRSELPNDPE